MTRTLTTERAKDALEGDLRKKLHDGTPTATEIDQRIDQVVDLSLSDRRPTRQQLRQALSSYGGESAWQRGRTFAMLGFVVGLPWTVLDIAAVFSTLNSGGPFRLVETAAGALIIMRFTIAGLVLGSAFPIVRGSTGLAKGLSLCVAMVGPALCVTLLPYPGGRDALNAALIQTTQWLSFSLIVGLTADWLTLRRAGYGLRQLRELHRMTTVTASASTILVAALTASATAVGSGAAGAFVDRVLTPPPAAPASSNQTNTGG